MVKRRSILTGILAFSLLFSLTGCSESAGKQPAASDFEAAASASPTPEKEIIVSDRTISYTTIEDTADQGIGAVSVYTLPLDEGENPVRATYLPSGKVLVFFGGKNNCCPFKNSNFKG